MPKFYISEHTKRKYAEAEESRKIKSRELRQAVSEHTAKVLQEQRKQRESERRQKLQERITESTAEGKAARKEINMLKDERFAYSKHLAKERVTNRIKVLELDRIYYGKEIKKFQDQELNADFLVDNLESIKTELAELKIDMEVAHD